MAQDQEYQPGAMEHARTYVDRELRRGTPFSEMVRHLVGSGMDEESAQALIDQHAREFGTTPVGNEFIAVIAGIVGALLGAFGWALASLMSGVDMPYLAILPGLIGGNAAGLFCRTSGFRPIVLGFLSAVVGLAAGVALLLARDGPSLVLEPLDLVYMGVGLVVAGAVAWATGGRFRLVTTLEPRKGRTEHPSAMGFVFLVVFFGLVTAALFLPWSSWEGQPAGGGPQTGEDYDWNLRSVTRTTTNAGATRSETFSYAEESSTFPAGAFQGLFDRMLAFALFASITGGISLLLFALPTFGLRVGGVYWLVSATLVAISVVFAAVAVVYMWLEFPDTVGQALGRGAGVVGGEPSPADELWGSAATGTGATYDWGAGLGWYLSVAAGAFGFGATVLPWPGRHGRPARVRLPAPERVPETTAAGTEEVPASAGWQEATPAAAPPPAENSTRLRCPSCSAEFDLFPQVRPYTIVCPSCARSTPIL